MKIGVVSDLTGSSDICSPVTDLASLQSKAYLVQGETVLFALSSPKEEYSFTNEAVIAICGESAMTSKRQVNRYEYQTEPVRSVRFESCGVTDRDCELKFQLGNRDFSIDIAKAEQTTAQLYYRVLMALARVQVDNQRRWDFAKASLDLAARSMMTTVASAPAEATSPFTTHATSIHHWYQAAFDQWNPRCYRATIEAVLLPPQ